MGSGEIATQPGEFFDVVCESCGWRGSIRNQFFQQVLFEFGEGCLRWCCGVGAVQHGDPEDAPA